MFIQDRPTDNRSIAAAVAQAIALPRAAATLAGARATDHLFADKQDVDTTGVAVPPSWVGAPLPASAVGVLGYRLSSALLHVAFAKQPASAYGGPVLKSAAWEEAEPPQQRARLTFGSVAPGRLALRHINRRSVVGRSDIITADGTQELDACELDVRFATSADLGNPATRTSRATVTLGTDGRSLVATAKVGGEEGVVPPANYTVVVFVGGTECELVGTASSNFSAPVAAVKIASAHEDLSASHHVQSQYLNQSSRGLFNTPPLGWNHW